MNPHKLIPVGKDQVAICDEADYELLSAHKWRLSSDGRYPRTNIKDTPVEMHSLLMVPQKGFQVDHKNGNRFDNRRENLRLVTPSQNQQNRRKCHGTSRFKGVCMKASRALWTAHIKANGRTNYLGSFENEEDAARAYDRAARKFFGEFARLNFPEPNEQAA